jgi:putative nucleotidyltransferase with HDIG domain
MRYLSGRVTQPGPRAPYRHVGRGAPGLDVDGAVKEIVPVPRPGLPGLLPAKMVPESLVAGRTAEQAGELDTALRSYRDTLGGLPEPADPVLAAELYRSIARVCHKRGNYAEALHAARLGLEQAERSAQPEQIVAALNAVAIAEQCLGELEQAAGNYLRAAGMADELGQLGLSAILRQNLATIASIRGDLTTSLEHYRTALRHLRRSGDAAASSRVLANIAMTCTQLADHEGAREALDEAERYATLAGELDLLAHIELTRANVLLAQEDLERARAHCDRALELYTRLESKSGLAETYKCYGVLYRAGGKPELAEAHLLMVVRLARECEDPLLEAEAEYERALVFVDQGRKREVLQALGRAQRLFARLRATRQVADVERRLDRLQETYLQVVRAWGESIESKDRYTAGHCGRVADYACLLAEAAGFRGRDLVWIRMGAFLHDVGKTAVPEEILNKPGPLDEAEWVVMRRHSTVGDEIVGELDFPFDIRGAVRGHHERWNAGGYPDGLEGEAIPLTARILSVVDTYDALTTTRAYRPAYTHEEALRIMDGLAGHGLDPALYRLFRVEVLGAGEPAPGSGAHDR